MQHGRECAFYVTWTLHCRQHCITLVYKCRIKVPSPFVSTKKPRDRFSAPIFFYFSKRLSFFGAQGMKATGQETHGMCFHFFPFQEQDNKQGPNNINTDNLTSPAPHCSSNKSAKHFQCEVNILYPHAIWVQRFEGQAISKVDKHMLFWGVEQSGKRCSVNFDVQVDAVCTFPGSSGWASCCGCISKDVQDP